MFLFNSVISSFKDETSFMYISFCSFSFCKSEIIFEKVNMTRQIIIKGKLVDNPKTDLFYFHLNVINQNITLNCVLKANSKFVQSKINCIIDIVKNNDIFIENQIIHSIYDENIEILLINFFLCLFKYFSYI